MLKFLKLFPQVHQLLSSVHSSLPRFIEFLFHPIDLLLLLLIGLFKFSDIYLHLFHILLSFFHFIETDSYYTCVYEKDLREVFDTFPECRVFRQRLDKFSHHFRVQFTSLGLIKGALLSQNVPLNLDLDAVKTLTEPLEETIEHPVARGTALDASHNNIIERA